MTDTAQPMAAESDGFADAANAFKVAIGQAEPIELKRNEKGQFTAAEAEADEPEADDATDLEPVEAQADTDDDDEQDDGAADEAQPQTAEKPASWGKDDDELWQSLPPEAQARIAEREGQREAAVNQKFQESANVKRAAEAQFAEAQNSRLQYVQAIDQVLNLVGAPAEPPVSMLNVNSSDYDPDGYHMARAQYEQTRNLLGSLAQQRQIAVAQHEQAEQQAQAERLNQINAQTAPAFLKDVPDASDQQKLPQVLQGLIQYAMEAGAPADVFNTPLSAMEWHLIWKAQQYDRLQAAKAKVGGKPAPEPRKPQPPVRPGVTTPRSAIEGAKRQKDFDRLRKSGSIADGAAVFKHFIKG